MKFLHVGKAYQLSIENGQDLADALTLDEALWVAMSAPLKAYTCDPKALAYIDSAKLGSITTESLKAAIRWLLDVYGDRAGITDHFDGKLPLAALTDSENARKIRHSAEYILKDLGEADTSAITLAQVRKFQQILTSRPLNGDGVISLQATGEASTAELRERFRELIQDGVKATGGTQDLDGTMGLTMAQLKTYWEAIPLYLAWKRQGDLPEGQSASPLLPFGTDTAPRLALLQENADRVDEFFRLCELQGFDSRLTGKVLEHDGKPGALDPTAWPGMESHLKTMPIVQPTADSAILLDAPEYINPLHRDWMAALTEKVLLPVLGAETRRLTPELWAKAKAAFAPYQAYMAAQQGGCCAAVDPARLEAQAQWTGILEEAARLEAKDLAVAQILKEAEDVEKALLYLQWLIPVSNNFISFPDLYQPKKPTLFERGRIVMDGRWFNMTFPVDNLAAHSALAVNSGLFLIYVEVDTAPAQILCAPVTVGDKGNLTVGKRGIFFAPGGQTYNAKVVKVQENPVCLREAVVAPFAKFGKMAEDKVAAMSTNSEGVITSKMAGLINDPKAAAAAAAPPPAAKGDKSGMLMGLGIAFAALSSALAFICKTLADMSALSILVSLLCVLAVLLTPIILLALIRLRRQDLSSLLEGNGWAINARMRLTRAQRKSFSRGGAFPADALGTPRRRCRRILSWLAAVLLVLLLGAGAILFGCRQSHGKREAGGCVAPAEIGPVDSAVPAASAENENTPAPAPAP
ncbi:MAG: hypothetical protein ACI4SG_03240 [Oligosphaeraceae bacterium]